MNSICVMLSDFEIGNTAYCFAIEGQWMFSLENRFQLVDRQVNM